jgi:hypothetical protein
MNPVFTDADMYTIITFFESELLSNDLNIIYTLVFTLKGNIIC